MNLSTEEIETYIRACYDAAESKGWHANVEDDIDAKIALLHSELSEALEEYRAGHDVGEIYFNVTSDHPDKPEGVPVELADFAIRLFDLCGMLGVFTLRDVEMPEKAEGTFSHMLSACHFSCSKLWLYCETPEASSVPINSRLRRTVNAVFNMATALDIDLREAIDLKMAYNAGRERRHGGKVV
jgi:NTP pyrophosphatase (non-canonical NTP hydrolase)